MQKLESDRIFFFKIKKDAAHYGDIPGIELFSASTKHLTELGANT